MAIKTIKGIQVVNNSASGGGGGGTTNYNDLSNQPKINGVTLVGDKTAADLGIVGAKNPLILGIYSQSGYMYIKGADFPISAINKKIGFMNASGAMTTISNVIWNSAQEARFNLYDLPSGAIALFVCEYDGTTYSNMSNGWALSASEGNPTILGIAPYSGSSGYFNLFGWNFDKLTGSVYVGLVDTQGYVNYVSGSYYSGSSIQTIQFQMPSYPSYPIVSAFVCQYSGGDYTNRSNGIPLPSSSGACPTITGSYKSGGYIYLQGSNFPKSSSDGDLYAVSDSGSISQVSGMNWGSDGYSGYIYEGYLPSATKSVFIAQYDGSNPPYYKNASNGWTISAGGGGGASYYCSNSTSQSVGSTDSVYGSIYDVNGNSVYSSSVNIGDTIYFSNGIGIVGYNSGSISVRIMAKWA